MLQTCVVAGLLLSACAPTPEQLNATVTSIAADIFAAQTAAPPTPTPVLVHLEANGSGDYPTLEEAVQNVPERATIVFGQGSYRLAEPLEIARSLRLTGAGMERTEIVSEAEGYVIRFNGDGPFGAEDITFRHAGRAEADVVVVQGGEMAFARCRFTGAVHTGGGDERHRAGLRIHGRTSGSVQDCVCEDNDDVGIAVEEHAQPVMEMNLCIDNAVIGIGYWGDTGGVARRNECSGSAFGIAVAEQAQPTLEGNVCLDNETGIAYVGSEGGVAHGNDCLGNGHYGISVSGQAQPALESNLCTESGEAGIAYFGETRGEARQNECLWNGAYGIRVGDQAQPTLEDNLCMDHGEAGIAFFGDAGGAVRRNVCGGGRVGIVVAGRAKPLLEDNLCELNEEDGITYQDEAGGLVQGNECSGNRRYGIYVTETANPGLVNNDCHDNAQEDIRDERP